MWLKLFNMGHTNLNKSQYDTILIFANKKWMQFDY